MNDTDLRKRVTHKDGQAALQARSGKSACCGGSDGSGTCDPITRDLHSRTETAALPETAVRASLGCGNPTALAQLQPGEAVLDLGSEGGIDVLLSARRAGPAGRVFGLDMTEEMLELAQENLRKSGLTNVVFLKGQIGSIPLPAGAMDVILSNCVINLSADKDQVFQEAFRVLKPDGRLAVSDVVVRARFPDSVRRNMELWIGCVAGALEESKYRSKLTAAGFLRTCALSPRGSTTSPRPGMSCRKRDGTPIGRPKSGGCSRATSSGRSSRLRPPARAPRASR